MLDVRHLEVSYGATRVLRDVSFSVEEGSIVALLGGNGSGKTTTLNVLSGLVAPQGGTVTLGGKRIDGLATDRVVAMGLVQVPQGREVWGGMTVHDNLTLGAARRRDRRASRSPSTGRACSIGGIIHDHAQSHHRLARPGTRAQPADPPVHRRAV